MEAVLAILGVILLVLVGIALVFSFVFQPLWGIIDVVTSKEHSSGKKATVILLTVLLLGPIMTFFYACFGSKSAVLKKTSIMSALTMLVGSLLLLGLSQVTPSIKNHVSGFIAKQVSEGPGEILMQPGMPAPAAPKTKFEQSKPVSVNLNTPKSKPSTTAPNVPVEPKPMPVSQTPPKIVQAKPEITRPEPAKIEPVKPKVIVPRIEEISQSVLDDELFVAVHNEPAGQQKWAFSVAKFALNDSAPYAVFPVELPGPYPLNQVAMDDSALVFYGITDRKVGRISPFTGEFEELELDRSLPPVSRPGAIAFDSRNRQLVVSSNSGTYTYKPDTSEWAGSSGFVDLNLVSLTYDQSKHRFYGLELKPGNREFTKVLAIDDRGAILSTIELSQPLKVSPVAAGRTQLVKSGNQIAILIASHYDHKKQLVPGGIYLVNPTSGKILRVAVEA